MVNDVVLVQGRSLNMHDGPKPGLASLCMLRSGCSEHRILVSTDEVRVWQPLIFDQPASRESGSASRPLGSDSHRCNLQHRQRNWRLNGWERSRWINSRRNQCWSLEPSLLCLVITAVDSSEGSRSLLAIIGVGTGS
jgi:hypothetical protein